MSRYARRVDDNHKAVGDALRKAGAHVVDTSRVGNGFPDYLVVYRGRITLLEVKDGTKIPSERRLSPAELAFHRACPIPIPIVLNPEDALRAIGAVTAPGGKL